MKLEVPYLDIDSDGDMDIIFPGEGQSNQIWWWENPYPADDSKPWTRRTIKNSGKNKHHDLLPGDFDGDGLTELAFWNQGANSLAIAEIPAKPHKAKEWELVSHIYLLRRQRNGTRHWPGELPVLQGYKRT